MTCNNSIANIESDQVQDGISKLANSNGNQNELKSNEDVKAVETGIILFRGVSGSLLMRGQAVICQLWRCAATAGGAFYSAKR